MPLYLDPTGRGTFGIGICGRCSRKFSLEDLYPDPNSPGLMVCLEDLDEYDPYRLPPRQPDNIVLPFTRPDVPLTDFVTSDLDIHNVYLLEVGGPYGTENGQFLSPEEVALADQDEELLLTEEDFIIWLEQYPFQE